MYTEGSVRAHIERQVRVLTLVTGQRAHRKTGHCAQKGTGQSRYRDRSVYVHIERHVTLTLTVYTPEKGFPVFLVSLCAS